MQNVDTIKRLVYQEAALLVQKFPDSFTLDFYFKLRQHHVFQS